MVAFRVAWSTGEVNVLSLHENPFLFFNHFDSFQKKEPFKAPDKKEHC